VISQFITSQLYFFLFHSFPDLGILSYSKVLIHIPPVKGLTKRDSFLERYRNQLQTPWLLPSKCLRGTGLLYGQPASRTDAGQAERAWEGHVKAGDSGLHLLLISIKST